ncbi:NfeD family protein [Tunicatimonas pelagia]|uniref:NfeD family protein n=1 Tax=Tunicatimonas pelagia TaxID=931531 RepID=UPI002665E383|nr:NfeD family protein [Tunicatimonas pelagia]WKN45740.1 NfeD family protein [Tunicatimonas pelagia]
MKYYLFFILLGGIFFVSPNQFAFSQSSDEAQVFVMEIRSEIDARTSHYVNLALEEAEDLDADYIVIDMDTYGGALYDADDIRTRMLEYEKPVYVFINKDAASAGALISIACDSIYMAPGASIGAATVVNGGTGEAAPDKYQSYMRGIMRSTAEASGRDPQIAEAMVDESIKIDSISEEGEVITFSTSEAIKYGYCEAQVSSIDELLARAGVENYQLTTFETSTVDQIISFFLNPVISGLLILVIIGGLYFELQTPGVGFPILASFVALTLYLTPYYLSGLAANWEIAALFLGVALIALEVFVIPGFGVAGISGIILVAGSLMLVMLNNNNFDFFFVDFSEITQALATILAGFFGGVLLMFFGGVRLTNTEFFQRVALQGTQSSTEGYTSNFKVGSFVGKEGEAYTILRPSGKIMIDDELLDAYTQGDYINQGERVVVVSDEGSSLRVKLVRDVQPQA